MSNRFLSHKLTRSHRKKLLRSCSSCHAGLPPRIPKHGLRGSVFPVFHIVSLDGERFLQSLSDPFLGFTLISWVSPKFSPQFGPIYHYWRISCPTIGFLPCFTATKRYSRILAFDAYLRLWSHLRTIKCPLVHAGNSEGQITKSAALFWTDGIRNASKGTLYGKKACEVPQKSKVL